MAEGRKLHMFLGAPSPALSAVMHPGSEPGPWRTAELHMRGGVLQLKRRGVGPPGRGGNLAGWSLPDCLPDSHLNTGAGATQNQGASLLQAEDHAAKGGPPSDTMALPQNREEERDRQEACPHALHEYLDSCFSNPETALTDVQLGGPVSTETEYLSVWTLSQVLVLKGQLDSERVRELPTSPGSTPELYSLASSRGGREGVDSPGGPHVFEDALSTRREEGGVQLEATPEGVLCSQRPPSSSICSQSSPLRNRGPEEPPHCLWPRATAPTSSPSLQTSPTRPAPKKSRASPSQDRSEDELGSTGRVFGTTQTKPTTLLSQCVEREVPYSILVVVLYPCLLKEVKVKSGSWAGSTVPLATIVVTDQSGVEMKVVLWRSSAFWALTVYPGDVLLITGVTVSEDKWREEVVLQSTRSSRLLNLGPFSDSHSPPVPRGISGRSLRMLCAQLREKHPLLLTLPPRTPQNPQHIPHVCLRALKPDTLVHAVLRVTTVSTVTDWCMEAAGFSRTAGVQKATLTVEQRGDQQGVLVLWGAAMAWLPRIQKNKNAVWEFQILLVKQNVSSGCLELHSTPWGSFQPLFPSDKLALEFCGRTCTSQSPAAFQIDMQTLLSQKYTGDVELTCHISGFQFQSGSSQDTALLMNNDTPLEEVLGALSGDVTFTGCGQCGSELTTDDNGIYHPCYPCLPHRRVRRYYRPAILTVKERDSEICIQVPPVLVQKILQDVPPEKLNKAVAPASDRKYVHVVADTLHTMLSVPWRTVVLTVHSHFQCDENSVSTTQDFLLLEFRLQP